MRNRREGWMFVYGNALAVITLRMPGDWYLFQLIAVMGLIVLLICWTIFDWGKYVARKEKEVIE